MGHLPAPIRLNTHLWNPVGERRALMLHGLGSDGGCWWRVASALADEGWLVLAPDLRSHGASPTAADHTIAAMAADVAMLGDGWDLVVGHSLGGAVAAELLTDSGLSAAAVLLDPVLHLDAAQHRRLRGQLHLEVGDLDPAAVAAANPAWDTRDVWRKVLAAHSVTPDVVDAVFDANDPWDLIDRADHWHARVHLLAADPAHDGLLAPDLADRLAAVGRVSAQTVVGAGHSIHRDRPDLVLDTIADLVSAR